MKAVFTSVCLSLVCMSNFQNAIKFVSDLQQTGRWFSPVAGSTNKTDHHDITEILLKVALNIIIQPNLNSQKRV